MNTTNDKGIVYSAITYSHPSARTTPSNRSPKSRRWRRRSRKAQKTRSHILVLNCNLSMLSRRLRDRDKQLDRQARMRDCHEAEIRHIAHEARSAQEKLATLHDLQSRIRTCQYSSLCGVHLPGTSSPMPPAVYTGEYPTSS